MTLQNYFTLKNIDPSKKYILGFSGGPDSTFLFFHLLKEIGNENFVVAHVNYHLRPESDAAEKLVKKYCEENNVESFFLNVKKTKYENVESWARKIRYSFFEEIGVQKNIKNILIAHNWNDDMETFIFQNERGNTVSYYGLKPETERNEFSILRPMLEIKKEEINNWISENKIEVDFDKTNSDESYARNKIRANFEKYDIEKLSLIKQSKNRMMSWVYKKIEPMLENEFSIEDFLPLNDKEEVVFIFEFLKQFATFFDVSNIKKNITGEIAKELRSNKSFIQIKLNKDCSIIKDRLNVFLAENKNLNITKLISNENQLDEFNFVNKNEIIEILNQFGSVTISNDWSKYQSKFTFKGKTLKKYFSDKKISYRWKIENAIIFNEGESNILNKTI